MKKSLSVFLCLFIILCALTILPVSYSAADVDISETGYTIGDNGTGGLYIDINSDPYAYYSRKSYGQYAYGPSGCAWFASARACQITGKDSPIFAGNTWYYNQYSNYGYTRGQTIRAKALVCYENHVAVIEAVNGNSVLLSEGGNSSYPNNGYCVIRFTTVSEVQGSGFLGYVYLGGSNPDPTPQGHVMSESEAAGQTIPDGDYWICNKIADDYFIDISGDTIVSGNGTNVQMGISKLPGKYDVFHFKYLNNGFYMITQMNSGMALDVYEGRLDIGANVNMWQASGSNAQQWSIETTEGGYKLRSRCCAYYLDVSGASYSGGTNLQVWEGDNPYAQYFGLIPYAPDERPLADGLYAIGSALSNSCFLDIPGSPENYKIESNVQVWNNMDEKFLIEYAGNGYYQIEVANTDLVLDVNNDGSISYLSNCRNTQICDKNNKRNQRWKIRKNNEGTYYFISQINGYYLDIEGANSAAGTNVSVHQYNGKANQKWKPIRVLQDSMVTVSDVEVSSMDVIVSPEVSVKVDNTTLKADTDYTVNVTADIASGKGTVTVTGKDNYCDTVTKSFNIVYNPLGILGDVDDDGEVGVIDATYIQRYDARFTIPVSEEIMLLCGDIDGDREVGIIDATLVQRYNAGFRVAYPIGEAIA